MTGKEYADIIDGFDVENNSKYLPSGGYTYCNIFAQDVADACDTPLPTGGCENMWNSLAHNQFPKWWSVTYKQAQSRANDGIPSIGITKDRSWMDYPFTCSLYDYAYNYPSEDDDGLIVFNDTYGAGYKMAKSSSLYNGSGTATTSISSYTRVWFNSDAGTAGATKPYLVTISGYSTYANNKWTYHSISATTFVDAGFNTGKVSTYKMNTLQE